MIALAQGITAGTIAGPMGVPWPAWAVVVAIFTMLVGLGVHGAVFAFFMGRLSRAVDGQGKWLAEVSTNTKETTEAVIALKARLEEKVIAADKEYAEFRRTDDDLCERITSIEDRERDRLERVRRLTPPDTGRA